MWVSRAEYTRLLTALDVAETRAYNAEAALAAERAENRRAERWMANMLLRRAGTYPVPDKAAPVQGPPLPVELEQAGSSEVPGMDPAELEAVVLAGADYGQTRADVIAFLRRERGLIE